MTTNPSSGSISIFKDGKLKPGVYKIQNIYSETYLDIEIHSRGVCCRPANDLGEGRGLWELKSFGAGYTVQVVEPGKPDQFCTLMEGIRESSLSVAAYPVAWRVEIANDDKHRGFEYVRFYWGITNWAWNLVLGSKANGTEVVTWADTELPPDQIWKLIPVKVERAPTPSHSSTETFGLGSLPSYDVGAAGQSSARTQHTEESERDDFGTIVTEVTTITTRRRYRVEDAT